MDDIKVTHNNLPEAVGVIYQELVNTKKELEGVKSLFDQVVKRLDSYATAPRLNEEDPDQLFTIEEAAEFCRVKRNAIHVWKRSGKIPYIKIGGRPYFKKADLLTYNKVDIKKPKGLR
ncbi:helix-turn-helix domain-containing protein [Sphingobacterium corticibacter]|uniref:Helix-turn-helix domain-containing protein n=1 Tax=Sphingobacterium corticibacter TaxID=2171749 RepID=A0A2T8HLS3_9SPHI|nr:helix-turn-helix domain-containing protein [Sphingobacterium corticibacter]PVH26262.1 hypothetical protein DC487_01155 [Sphingobacterium corticibacter]